MQNRLQECVALENDRPRKSIGEERILIHFIGSWKISHQYWLQFIADLTKLCVDGVFVCLESISRRELRRLRQSAMQIILADVSEWFPLQNMGFETRKSCSRPDWTDFRAREISEQMSP